MTDTAVISNTEACAPSATHAIGTEAATTVAGALKALADPLRLRMLSAIAIDPRGESCVCDLAELAEVSQPTVSHHLKVLKETGMLLSERRVPGCTTASRQASSAPSRLSLTRSLPPQPPWTSPKTPQHGPRPCSRWTPA